MNAQKNAKPQYVSCANSLDRFEVKEIIKRELMFRFVA
jgi:hypothetical protein